MTISKNEFVAALQTGDVRVLGDSFDQLSRGSQSPNWAIFSLDAPPPLTTENIIYTYQESDISIISQSGDDFSVGIDSNFSDCGAIISSNGGGFQFGGYVSITNATIDAGSVKSRYVWFGATLGNTPDVIELGLDVTVPAGASDDSGVSSSMCVASLPGYGSPGGVAVSSMEVGLVNAFGNDSVPLNSIYRFMVWSI